MNGAGTYSDMKLTVSVQRCSMTSACGSMEELQRFLARVGGFVYEKIQSLHSTSLLKSGKKKVNVKRKSYKSTLQFSTKPLVRWEKNGHFWPSATLS